MKIGVVIANTGSPASPEPDDIEAYLREFLMDERIRQLPKPVWKYLLRHHILPKRKYKSSARYRFIWTEDGSPLITIQQALCQKVQGLFDARPPEEWLDDQIRVRCAMSYGQPSINGVLQELRSWGAELVVLLPLYPQSAYSPTMAVVDSFWRALGDLSWQPRTLVVDNYHDNPAYIRAIADSVRAVGYNPKAGDRLMFSLHAIPLKDEKAGDGYRAQVQHSTDLIAEELGIAPDAIIVSYQSVFGHNKNAWVSPLSTDVLKSWRNQRFRVVFACPGFAVDCLETLYDVPHEIAPALEGDEARPNFSHVDGDIQSVINTTGRFVWVPSLNDSDVHAQIVKDVLDKALTRAALEG